MRRFNYNDLNNYLLPARIMDYTYSIGYLKGRLSLIEDKFKALLAKLSEKALLYSTKASNEIEGIVVSLDKISKITYGLAEPENEAEALALGYSDVLEYISDNYKSLEISEELILKLHKMLYRHTKIEGGCYKMKDNNIVSIDSLGNKSLRFMPISALDTPKAMEQLILAYLDAKDDSSINSLLLIPCFILDFLCIHPFSDGNGRISRLLTLLLLYKNGYDVCKYISFESHINKIKNLYYDALKESSYEWELNKNDYSPFIKSFLAALYFCYKDLDNNLIMVNGNKLNKTKRIETFVLGSIVPISKGEICASLLDISKTTVELVLGKMIKNGSISRIGSGRNTKYIKN